MMRSSALNHGEANRTVSLNFWPHSFRPCADCPLPTPGTVGILVAVTPTENQVRRTFHNAIDPLVSFVSAHRRWKVESDLIRIDSGEQVDEFIAAAPVLRRSCHARKLRHHFYPALRVEAWGGAGSVTRL